MMKKKPRCYFCWHNRSERVDAMYVAAQSDNAGRTVTWKFICADHRDGWNDGGDWVSPVFKLGENEAP